ncbi:MAG: HAMP domain-containing protein, partial [Clostridia bacterium]|nr:HAMP domain-containing protein [Clostridia bacterium]
MKSLLRKLLSLRGSLLSFMLLSWLIPTILLGIFMGTRFFQTLQEKTEASLISGAEHAQANTLDNITYLISLAKGAVYDEELTTAVNSYESGKINDEAYFRLCRGYLERKYGRENLCHFALFYRLSDPATIFYTSDHYQDATYFIDYVQPAMLELSKTLDTRCIFYARQDRIYLARNLYNSRLELYGMLLLGIDVDQLFAPIYAWSAQWSLDYGLQLDTYRVGDMATMNRTDGLSDQDDLLLYTLTEETRDYQFRFQVQASKMEVYHEMDVFRRIMVWMFILVVPLCLVIMVFVNRRIARPVDILCEASSRIQNGELGITVPIHGDDELGRLGNAFSNMSVQLKTLVDQSYKAEIA